MQFAIVLKNSSWSKTTYNSTTGKIAQSEKL